MPDPAETVDQLPRALSSELITDSYIDDFMETILDPSSGLCNPEKGFDFPYASEMNGKTIKPIRTKKVALAENIKHLMESKYLLSQNKPKSLSKDASVSLSSVQRALSGETAPTLDTLEAFAEVFNLTIGELVDGNSSSRVQQITPPGIRGERAKSIFDLLSRMDESGLAVMLDKAKDVVDEYPITKQTQKLSA